MSEKTCVISAAGGNITAIKSLATSKSRAEYAALGRQLLAENKNQSVEQAGFLILSDNHFEMSGGEFCGNAARGAAILIARQQKTPQPKFTMSGFKGEISGQVNKLGRGQYRVTCYFPGLSIVTSTVYPPSLSGQGAVVADLGGIVHVIIEATFPRTDFIRQQRQIIGDLGLTEREAVGVVWVNRQKRGFRIDPVVWVKEIDSLFYESSCGSGSIAAAQVLKTNQLVQPTGEVIEVIINSAGVAITSQMEVLNEAD